MQISQFSDDQLFRMIRSGGAERDSALKQIYLDTGLKKSIYKVLNGMGAQENDIFDTFQDALIILDRNIRGGKFDQKSGLKTYFIAIAKWHQLSKLRKQKKTDLKSDMTGHDQIDEWEEDKMIDNSDSKNAVRNLLEKVGEKCKSLMLMYMQNMKMKEIARRQDINEQSAKNAVHRCRTKLRKMIADDPRLSLLLKK